MMLATFICAYIAATNQPTIYMGVGGSGQNVVIPTNTISTQVVKQHSNVMSNNTYYGTVPIYSPSLPAGVSTVSMKAYGNAFVVQDTNYVGTGAGGVSTLQTVFNTTPLSASVMPASGNVTISSSITYNWINFTSGIPETSCLQYKARQNLITRTNGTSYMTFVKVPQWTLPSSPPYIVPNSWLLGVTNAFCMGYFDGSGQNRAVLVPIAPRFCTTEAHVGNMGSVVFVNPDGVTLQTNGVIQAYVITNCTGSGDLSICLMSNTVPAFMKVMPSMPYIKNKVDQYYPYPPVVVRYRRGTCEMLCDSNAFSSFTSSWCPWSGSLSNCCETFFSMAGDGINPNYPTDPRFGHYSPIYGDKWVNGDSSSPAFIVIDNEAYLIAQAWFQTDGPGHDTNAVNAAMYYLSTNNAAPIYQETPIDPAKIPDL